MTDTSGRGPAIDVRPLLAEHYAASIDLLRRLDAGEWARPTVRPGWRPTSSRSATPPGGRDSPARVTSALQIVSIIWSPPLP
jgi:hypothetical protein